MSWILKRKKIVLGCLILVIFCLLFTPFWPISCLFSIGIILLLLNHFIVRKIYAIRTELSALRSINSYRVLVIGDMCKKKTYSSYLQNVPGHSLLLLSPKRSLDASFQILLHTESILEENGCCIIIHNGKFSSKLYSIFDIPYLSFITKKELGLDYLEFRSRWPLIFDLQRSLMFLLNIHSYMYSEKECPDQRIQHFCQKKGIQLIYLTLN